MSIKTFVTASLLAAGVAAACAQTPAASPPPAAPVNASPFPEALPDAHWAPIGQLVLGLDRSPIGLATRAPGGIMPYRGWEEFSKQLLRRFGLSFYNRYPDDPRRWQWLAETLRFKPIYLKQSIDPAVGYTGESEHWLLASGFGAKVPEHLLNVAERDAWNKLQPKLVADSQTAADCSMELRADIAFWDLWGAYLDPAMPTQPTSQDIARWKEQRLPLTRKFVAFAKQYPDYEGHEGKLKALVYVMMDEVPRFDPEGSAQFLKDLRTSPNRVVSSYSGAEQELAKARTQPVEMRFTSIDGREVDLAKLRGKVVLIDYWGTWCDKCHLELPWLKDLYAKYHSQGFEIVSVMMEPGNTEKDRQRALKDIRKNGLESWHHYVTTMNDPYVVKYGVQGAPTHLLLDGKGLLVEKSVGTWHPTRLEPLLRKHLGLMPETPSGGN